MLLGFKRRFEWMVKDCSKRHTLRDRRKGERQIRVDDRLDCYGDSRQKTMHLIGRWPCTRVQVARFYVADELRINSRVANGIEYLRMSIDGVELTFDEADAFAWRDGFRFMRADALDDSGYLISAAGCFRLMMSYWIDEGVNFPFTKDLIHWDYGRPTTKAAKAPGVKCRRKRSKSDPTFAKSSPYKTASGRIGRKGRKSR